MFRSTNVCVCVQILKNTWLMASHKRHLRHAYNKNRLRNFHVFVTYQVCFYFLHWDVPWCPSLPRYSLPGEAVERFRLQGPRCNRDVVRGIGVKPYGMEDHPGDKVADLSPKNIFGNKQSATDGTTMDLNIGETRVWRLDSRPNLQP